MSTRVTVIRSNPNNIKNAQRETINDLKMVIAKAARMVEGTAKLSIQNSPRGGAAYTRYNPRRSGRASAPGEPPATDTGFLVSNITHRIDPDGLGADIESAADYSGHLEFGTSKMAARPYMVPAVEENRAKIRQLVVQVVRGNF